MVAPAVGQAHRRGSWSANSDGRQSAHHRTRQDPDDRSKHIDIKYHFLRDCVDGGQIVLEFVETGRQLADILTESLWSSSVLGAEGEDWHGGTQSQGLCAVGLGEEL